MKDEEVKRELQNLRHLRKKIKILNEELEELNELGKIPKKIVYERTAGGISTAVQDKYLVLLEGLQENIELVIQNETVREKRILNAINKIDSELSNLLMDRYIRGKSIARLCNDYNYSRQSIHRLLKKGIKQVDKILKIGQEHKVETL